jgi:hypothetical protein
MRGVNKANVTYEELHLHLRILWSEEPSKRCCGCRVYHWGVGNLAPAGPLLGPRFGHVSTAIISISVSAIGFPGIFELPWSAAT